jgi:DNA-binding IclR family transcriptional regulator
MGVEMRRSRTKARPPAATPAGRAFAILRVIARSGEGIPFGRLLADCAPIPKATLARHLKSLLSDGLVAKDPDTGRYRVGAACVDFARAVLGERPRGEVLQPVLEALARETGESIAYFELDDEGAVLLAKVDMPDSWHFIPVYARNVRPDHAAATTILAHAGESAVAEYFAARGITSRAERSRVRERIEAARRPGVFNAAPVIVEGADRPVGALVLSCLAEKSRRNELRAALARAAARAGELIGPCTR